MHRRDGMGPAPTPFHQSSGPAKCPRGNGPTKEVPPPPLPLPTSSIPSESSTTKTLLSKLNPLNYMPVVLSQEKAPGQTVDLPISRERSTIPKADGTGSFWEYPSPQQMYNAMVRKGYDDTPTDAVESMVAVHNFLNEGAWAEILEWERRFADGLIPGAKLCMQGEENAKRKNGSLELVEVEKWGSPTGEVVVQEELTTDWDTTHHGPSPLLARFMGRPDELTPKARMMQFLGWASPDRFGTPPPFDRHDWYVVRHNRKSRACPMTPTDVSPTAKPADNVDDSAHSAQYNADGTVTLPPGSEMVRYVIDYYEGPADNSPDAEPVFYLDVRPAVDSPDAAARRLVRWCGDVWWRAMGGDVRDQKPDIKSQVAGTFGKGGGN